MSSSFDTTLEDPRVALSDLLVRGAIPSMIENRIKEVLSLDTIESIKDLFVMAFQARDIRGGKGERQLFRDILDSLFKYMPELTLEMLHLIPEYGCWDDLFQLTHPKMMNKVIEITVTQLKIDSLSDGPISLCAKWAPRENRQGDIAKLLAKALFPEEDSLSRRLKSYRKLVAGLNRKLQTTEIAMCDRQFASIEPENVPRRCLQKHMKAFLNKSLKSEGMRYPDDEDRMKCRKNFKKHFTTSIRGEVNTKDSKAVFPHEIIKKALTILNDTYYNEDEYTDEMNAVLSAWDQLVKDTKAAGGLSRSVAMCDFSISMKSAGSDGDTPYLVSLAMGLLISKVTTREFRDTILSFDSTPDLKYITYDLNLFERIRKIRNFGQGSSTNFQAAMDRILTRLKNLQCSPGQEPENLIVLTDMDWDEACGSNETIFFTGHSYRNVLKNTWQKDIGMIREAFKKAGEDLWGEGQGFKMPRIVFWNVASSNVGFHSDVEGVVMLSGLPSSIFKSLQTGGEICRSRAFDSMRLQLDNKRYDLVREYVNKYYS